MHPAEAMAMLIFKASCPPPPARAHLAYLCRVAHGSGVEELRCLVRLLLDDICLDASSDAHQVCKRQLLPERPTCFEMTSMERGVGVNEWQKKASIGVQIKEIAAQMIIISTISSLR